MPHTGSVLGRALPARRHGGLRPRRDGVLRADHSAQRRGGAEGHHAGAICHRKGWQ